MIHVWLRFKAIVDRFSLRFVPTHLRLVYWADLPLFLSAVGLIVRFLGAPAWPQAAISGGAIAGGLLLLYGWISNSRSATGNGAAVMMAVWGGQLTYLLATFGDQIIGEFRESANLILGAAFFTLAAGVWWATVTTPTVGVGRSVQ